MCSSLDGSQSRAATSTAAIFAQAMRSLPAGKQPLAQLLKARPAPQRQRQIHIAELTRALDANALQAHRHRQMSAAVVEQPRLLGCADQPASQRPRLNATVLIKLAKMRHRLLNDTTPDTNAAHQPPIAVNLPVLLANRVAQIHAPSEPDGQPKEKTQGRHYTLKSAPRAS